MGWPGASQPLAVRILLEKATQSLRLRDLQNHTGFYNLKEMAQRIMMPAAKSDVLHSIPGPVR